MKLDTERPLLPQIWAASATWEQYKSAMQPPRRGTAPLLPNGLDAAVRTCRPMHLYPTFVVLALLLSSNVPVTDMFMAAMTWPLLEYALHRFGMHDFPDLVRPGRAGQCVHFLLHGYHHMFPWDTTLLLWPTFATVGFLGATALAMQASGVPGATAVAWSGGLWLGYSVYDAIHFFVHCRELQNDVPTLAKWLSPQIRSHTNHHFATGPASRRFGVSVPGLDDVAAATKLD